MTDYFAFDDSTRLMMLAPHPDDETLATGGLLQRASQAGARILVLYATNGENNPWPQRVLERRWHMGTAERARWGQRRRDEALAALDVLGVPPDSAQFWDLPDQGLTGKLLRDPMSLACELAERIAVFAPTHLLAPSLQDRHPDHSALGILALLAKQHAADSGPNFRILHYVVHGRYEAPASQSMRLHLSEDAIAVKRQAIGSHVTQMVLSRKRFLDYARTEEIFLTQDPDEPVASNHPIRRVGCSESQIVLEIVAKGRLHSLGGSRLVVLGHHAGKGFSITGTVTRFRENGSFVEVVNGERVHATSTWLDRHTVRQQLDYDCGTGPAIIFTKWEPRLAPFDRAGWRLFRSGVCCASES